MFTKNLHWYYGPTDIDVLEQYEDLALADSTLTDGEYLDGSTGIYLPPFFSFLSSFYLWNRHCGDDHCSAYPAFSGDL